MQSTSLAEFIGEIVATTRADAISGRAIERAKVSLLHNLAVGLAGRRLERVAHRIAASCYSVPAESTVLASGGRVSIEGAVLANGALFHARSQDDTHPDSTSHPGGPVMAAALATAEALESSGSDFLAAVVLGYEALCRIGRDFDQQITGRGFRAAAVLAPFGAAASSARLMRLSAEDTTAALGLAAHMAGGLAQVWLEGSPEYTLQLAYAARNGVAASRAAACGARSARFAFEGRRGFFNAYAGTTAEAVEARSNFDGSWQIEEATVKPFPACAILQGPLDLVVRMLRGEDAGSVAAVRLHLNPYEAAYPGIDHFGPCATPAAAKMSARFCLGNALARGRLAFSDLEAIDDAATAEFADRVAVVSDPAIAERCCRIDIDWHDGHTTSRILDMPIGRPSFEEAARFAIGLAPEMELPDSDVAAIVEIVADLDRQPSLARLVEALARRPARTA